MPARIDRIHSERVRARIRLSQIVTRLQNFALGRNGIEMTPDQVRAAIFLIDKSMANLPSRQEHSGIAGEAIESRQIVEFVHVVADEKPHHLNGNGKAAAPS